MRRHHGGRAYSQADIKAGRGNKKGIKKEAPIRADATRMATKTRRQFRQRHQDSQQERGTSSGRGIKQGIKKEAPIQAERRAGGRRDPLEDERVVKAEELRELEAQQQRRRREQDLLDADLRGGRDIRCDDGG